MNITFNNIVLTVTPALLSVVVVLIDLWLARRRKKEQIIVAEAGKVSEMRGGYQPYVYMNPITMHKGIEKSIVVPSDCQRVIVHGHCMEPRGIMDCSQLLVQNITQEKEFSLQVKHNDILLIYLSDKDIYKLRVFDKYLDNENLLTYRYNPKTGDRIDSSMPHARKSVVGVVRYAIS